MKKFVKIITVFLLLLNAVFFCLNIELSAGNAVSNTDQGWALLERGSLQKALFKFRDALNENPSYGKAIHGLARTYYETEVYNEAVDLYRRLIKIEGKSYNASVGLGMSFTKIGDYKKAIAYFEEAEKITPNDMEASYGIAFLYYSMGKKIWSVRKIESILRFDPFHFKTLLLLADLKSAEGRLGEARKYIEKAIESNQNSPEGFVKFAEILLMDYIKNKNNDSLAEAEDVLANALSINPEHYRANLIMGYISIEKSDYSSAALYFKKAGGQIPGAVIDYNTGIAFDKAGNARAALENFLKAYEKENSDSIVRCRLEDFLVLNNYKSGHPARIMLSRKNLEIAQMKMKNNFSDESVMYLRRSLLLNPLDENIRRILMSYYSALEYNRYYIDELKELARMNPGRKYRDMLAAAIALRRQMLYHRAGYSDHIPARDVPVILVLNYIPANSMPRHPDAGEVLANNISLVMEQFGRMVPIPFRKRQMISRSLGRQSLQKDLEKIAVYEKNGDIPCVDYILYGDFNEDGEKLGVHSYLIDKKTGVLVSDFSMGARKREKIPQLSLRIVRKVFDIVPYSGRVLKINDSDLVVNLGLLDGIGKGDSLVIYKFSGSKTGLRKKILLQVLDSSTIVSLCKPLQGSAFDEIESSDKVLPLLKRRARLVE